MMLKRLEAVPLEPMLMLKRSPVRVVVELGCQSRPKPVKLVEVEVEARERREVGAVVPIPKLPASVKANSLVPSESGSRPRKVRLLSIMVLEPILIEPVDPSPTVIPGLPVSAAIMSLNLALPELST